MLTRQRNHWALAGSKASSQHLAAVPASSACCLSDNAIVGLWLGDLHESDCSTMRLRREENQRRGGEDTLILSFPGQSASLLLLCCFYCCSLMH